MVGDESSKPTYALPETIVPSCSPSEIADGLLLVVPAQEAVWVELTRVRVKLGILVNVVDRVCLHSERAGQHSERGSPQYEGAER